MKLLRKIAIVFVPLYYMVTRVRNILYDLRLLLSESYDFPVLAVGNLNMGGTGKTPMVEYLIRLLQDKKQLATLSRGYGRATTGFRLVEVDDDASEVGDEPLQFKRKFIGLHVAVDEDRNNGIDELRANLMPPGIILLDDAFQHRKVRAGMYILLTSHDKLYVDDMLLPTGDLRESKRGARRADIVVVTKCPADLTPADQKKIADKLRIKDKQSLYFSTIVYEQRLRNNESTKSLEDLMGVDFSLVTGIANPEPLVEFFRHKGLDFDHLEYPDHHDFSSQDLEYLRKLPLVITTEKDYARLAPKWSSDTPLWYQAMDLKFISKAAEFDAQVMEFSGVLKGG